MKETVGATRNISALLSFAVARFGTAEETVGAMRNMSALLSFAAARFGTLAETMVASRNTSALLRFAPHLVGNGLACSVVMFCRHKNSVVGNGFIRSACSGFVGTHRSG